MAEKNSYSCSDIEEIHNELMRVLINGHVGFNEDSETHTNWKMKFKTYCDDTTERKGCVRGNIECLEKKKTIGHGNYGVLKKIFAEDEKALCKIEEALTEIEKLRSSANISNKNTKDEKTPNANIFVEVENVDNVFLTQITSFLRKLVKELKSEFSSIQWKKTRHRNLEHQVHVTDEKYAKFSTRMNHYQECLAALL